ncbi:MAG: ribosome assembly cofactor RimP [Candidatus Pseudobacter hemicellulosilyticus]|uniref:Ribosome maturation factor RimP n=1 Tax=Candidatus Pseudobacter hemicellulosilyticus TaxID=3121375 RepID=A0AAJ5WWW3_9BACT|nr:MAG: ribosome assembly cofactor RimP [Pseudobacter sp.]
MSTETHVQAIEKMVEALLVEDPAYFLVDIRIKPTNNVKLFLDGDQGITVEKCIQINRALYKQLEESGLFPADDFSLEVSSPGLDEPLRLQRQYNKNVGRPVEVLLTDGRKVEGKMTAVTEQGIEVEEVKYKNPVSANKARKPGKNDQLVMHQFPFDAIKSTKIQITF